MFGNSWIVRVVVFAMLVCVACLVGLVWVSRRRRVTRVPSAPAAANTPVQGNWLVRWLHRRFPPINPEDIGEPVNPRRTIRFFIGVIITGLVLAAANLLLFGQFWLSVAFWPISVALIITVAKLYGVIVSLEEGEAINVDRWGGYHHSMIAFRGHVVLGRRMVDLISTPEASYLVGEIVNVSETLTKLRANTAAPPNAVAEFEKFARAQERANNMFGGLRVVGWPWIDQIHEFAYPSVEISRVENGTTVRYKEKPVTRTGQTRLLLTDIPKPLVLEGVETAPLPDLDDQRSSGYGFPVDLLLTSFVRVLHPYLAVYKTREGWASILTNLLRPEVLGIVRRIEAGEVSDQLASISQQVLDRLQSATIGTAATMVLRSRYGLELLRIPIQDTQMSDPKDDLLLQLVTKKRIEGRGAVVEARFGAQVIERTRQAEANGVQMMVEAASGDPETARLAIKADAAKNAKGTVILSLGGDDKPAIDPGQQVLIERLDRLTAAMEKGQKGKKKAAGGTGTDVPDTSDEDDEEATK